MALPAHPPSSCTPLMATHDCFCPLFSQIGVICQPWHHASQSGRIRKVRAFCLSESTLGRPQLSQRVASQGAHAEMPYGSSSDRL